MVVGELGHDDALVHGVVGAGIGTAAGIVLGQVGHAVVAVLAIVAVSQVGHHQVLVDDVQPAEQAQEGGEGLVEGDDHGLVIGGLHGSHVVLEEVGVALADGDQTVIAEHHVLGGHVGAVVELNPVLQDEGVGQVVVADGVVFRHALKNGPVQVGIDQGVVEVHHHLVGGIVRSAGGVEGVAEHGGGADHLAGVGGGAAVCRLGVGGAAAAAGQSQHQHGQRSRCDAGEKASFHSIISPFLWCIRWGQGCCGEETRGTLGVLLTAKAPIVQTSALPRFLFSTVNTDGIG